MLAETALRQHVSRGSAERGDDYFVRGRVKRIEALGNAIEADVQGSRLYSVDLTIDNSALDIRCDCPWYVQHAEVCKHIWAAIRAASANDLLPDRELRINPEEPAELDNVRTFTPRGQRAAWERFLEALGPATLTQRTRAPRNVPDEIAYVLLAFARSPTFTLQLLGRARKKGGEWGKWKPLSLRLDDLTESIVRLRRIFANRSR